MSHSDSSEDVNGQDSDESDGPDLSDLLGTSQSIGEHAFSKMEADVDKSRHIGRNSMPSANVAEIKRLRYVELKKPVLIKSFVLKLV